MLADEINRTPPKTQAALLEAMQERQVTVGGTRHQLPDPFFVLATQNPIEQEGTYPLPEAQQDRFMFKINVDYPTEEEEFRIIESTTSRGAAAGRPRGRRRRNAGRCKRSCARCRPPGYVIRYAMKLAAAHAAARAGRRAGRPERAGLREEVRDLGRRPAGRAEPDPRGEGPGAAHGRTYVATEDMRAVALPVLRHRIITNYNAEADGVTPDEIVRKLLDAGPARADRIRSDHVIA